MAPDVWWLSRRRDDDDEDSEEEGSRIELDPVKKDERLIPDDPWLLKGPECPESALVDSVGTGPMAELWRCN